MRIEISLLKKNKNKNNKPYGKALTPETGNLRLIEQGERWLGREELSSHPSWLWILHGARDRIHTHLPASVSGGQEMIASKSPSGLTFKMGSMRVISSGAFQPGEKVEPFTFWRGGERGRVLGGTLVLEFLEGHGFASRPCHLPAV